MFSSTKALVDLTEETQEPSTVPAQKYTIQVYEGIMDYVHSGGETILEYFIPSHQVCFNNKTAFRCEEPRSKDITDILLPQNLVDEVVKIAGLKEELQKAETVLKSMKDFQTLFKEKYRANHKGEVPLPYKQRLRP